MNLNLQAGMVLGVVQFALILLVFFVSIPMAFYLSRNYQEFHNQGVKQNKYKSIYAVLQFGVIYFFLVFTLIWLLFQIESGPT